jgi:hypothetical protein
VEGAGGHSPLFTKLTNMKHEINVLVLFNKNFKEYKLMMKTLDSVLLDSTAEIEDYRINVHAPIDHTIFPELVQYSEIYGYECMPLEMCDAPDLYLHKYPELLNSVDYTILFVDSNIGGYVSLTKWLQDNDKRFKRIDYFKENVQEQV